MLIDFNQKAVKLFHGPEAGGKSPEYKPNPEGKENPNDYSKPANREALYKKAEAKISELLKKGDAESKKMAEQLRKSLTVARDNEKQKLFEPKEIADSLSRHLDDIIGKTGPELGMTVTASPEARAKARAQKKKEKEDAAGFGIVELVRAMNATPGPTLGFSDAAAKKDDKPKPAIEVAPVVITARPINSPNPPYKEVSVAPSDVPDAVRRQARGNDIPGKYYYQTSDGRRYLATVKKYGDSQATTSYKRIDA